MKITNIENGYVEFDTGATKSVNEVVWNFRSTCCDAPIDIDGCDLVCSACGAKDGLDVTHKAARAGGVQIADVINALPDDARDKATSGYYKSLKGVGIHVVHIYDNGGNGETYALAETMRR